ncbi:hypothetical protein EX219_09750 [Bacillus aerophilus]|nr:hypothetical protein [Bacillus aerophilus]MBX7013609.1 hypothetical protein [Bacillus aerophilus]
MVSVTKRIKEIKQPRGGYINPKNFLEADFNDGIILHEEENIHSSLIGLSVDYLTRFVTKTSSAEDAFKISVRGANRINELSYANELLDGIIGLDDTSIVNACKLVGYDVIVRAGINAYKPVSSTPDLSTIKNIRTMVERSKNFINSYGPIVKEGFTFEGAYTNVISTGDGDFLTRDTLWDFKVSKNKPSKDHTLQLIIYYLLGMRSFSYETFQKIENLGIFNPRLNKSYTLEVKNISSDIIEAVSIDVIGYKR